MVESPTWVADIGKLLVSKACHTPLGADRQRLTSEYCPPASNLALLQTRGPRQVLTTTSQPENPSMNKLNRREYLKAGIATTAGLGAALNSGARSLEADQAAQAAGERVSSAALSELRGELSSAHWSPATPRRQRV